MRISIYGAGGIGFVAGGYLKRAGQDDVLFCASLNIEAWSSTWQSMTRRQGSIETDFLNREVVRLAEKPGCQTPINEELLRICQETAVNHEPPAKYIPAELRKQFGLCV